jgi:hypothetical protein
MRESDHAGSLLWALTGTFFFVDSYCGNYTTANARVDELIALADEKDAAFWKAFGTLGRGWLLGLTGMASDAVQMITSGIAAFRSREQQCGSRRGIIFGGSPRRAWPTRTIGSKSDPTS